LNLTGYEITADKKISPQNKKLSRKMRLLVKEKNRNNKTMKN